MLGTTVSPGVAQLSWAVVTLTGVASGAIAPPGRYVSPAAARFCLGRPQSGTGV